MKLNEILKLKLPFKRSYELDYKIYSPELKFSVEEILAEDYEVQKGELVRVGYIMDDDVDHIHLSPKDAWKVRGTDDSIWINEVKVYSSGYIEYKKYSRVNY